MLPCYKPPWFKNKLQSKDMGSSFPLLPLSFHCWLAWSPSDSHKRASSTDRGKDRCVCRTSSPCFTHWHLLAEKPHPTHTHTGVEVLTAKTIRLPALFPFFCPCDRHMSVFAHLSSEVCVERGATGICLNMYLTLTKFWIFSYKCICACMYV